MLLQVLIAFILLISPTPNLLQSGQVQPFETPGSLSEEERKKSIELLQGSMDKLVELTKELSPGQLNFRPSENRWSIMDNINHLIKVEDVVWNIITTSLAESGEGQKSDIPDEEFIKKMSTREQNFNAPARLQPKEEDYHSYREAIEAFQKARQRTIEFVKKTDKDLRGHFAQNPVFGNLDTFQWTLHPSTHCYRHIEQVEEILKHPNFPSR